MNIYEISDGIGKVCIYAKSKNSAVNCWIDDFCGDTEEIVNERELSSEEIKNSKVYKKHPSDLKVGEINKLVFMSEMITEALNNEDVPPFIISISGDY